MSTVKDGFTAHVSSGGKFSVSSHDFEDLSVASSITAVDPVESDVSVCEDASQKQRSLPVCSLDPLIVPIKDKVVVSKNCLDRKRKRVRDGIDVTVLAISETNATVETRYLSPPKPKRQKLNSEDEEFLHESVAERKRKREEQLAKNKKAKAEKDAAVEAKKKAKAERDAEAANKKLSKKKVTSKAEQTAKEKEEEEAKEFERNPPLPEEHRVARSEASLSTACKGSNGRSLSIQGDIILYSLCSSIHQTSHHDFVLRNTECRRRPSWQCKKRRRLILLDYSKMRTYVQCMQSV